MTGLKSNALSQSSKFLGLVKLILSGEFPLIRVVYQLTLDRISFTRPKNLELRDNTLLLRPVKS